MLNTSFFNTELPPRPMGKYAHIVMLRVTDGYALFQTDGELNKARVSAGYADTTPITRISLFKRKQTTPERLTGRELLRSLGLLTDETSAFGGTLNIPKDDKALATGAENYNQNQSQPPYACFYNLHSCKRCPDCIVYGFAIGDGGSEKSKIYADTAFSLTAYADSHEVFTLNAPYEDGTMADYKGETTSRINQQDHVKPQTIFPSVITTRDLTPSLFFYVLQNVLRTSRYGATTTRGGTMQNVIAAIVLSDGEIFSNLLFTQRLYDTLGLQAAGNEIVNVQEGLRAAEQVIPMLLAQDSVRDTQVLMGADLATFLDQVRGMDETTFNATLQQASAESQRYYEAYIAKTDKKKK